MKNPFRVRARMGSTDLAAMDVEEELQVQEQECRKIPPWTKQITARGLVASIIIGVMYSMIVMKLNLTTGLVPSLNISAALLAFVFLKSWTKLLHKAGVVSAPFTRQENCVVQTCAVACYSIAVGGGFGSYLLGLNKKTYERAGVDTEGNTPGSYKEPGIAWMTGFLFIVCFVGLLALVPLRKIMIIDYKLTYPSGTATAVLINGFHTPQGDKMAKKQVQGFAKFFTVFVTIALILGDGLYNFAKVMAFTIRNFQAQMKHKNINTEANLSISSQGRAPVTDGHLLACDKLHHDEAFVRDRIPMWVACSGYTLFSLVSILSIPRMFPEMRWYYVLTAYIFAPALGFCNAYGAGLTDMNMAYNYGKVALFVLAAWSGSSGGGVVAGLVGCGLVKSIVSISADLMQDFKSAHLTLTSPRSMVMSQAIGTAIGCVTAPLSFWLFYKAFDIGNPDGEFKAPYALIYRNMAILGVEGFSALPLHCLQLCYGFFAFAMLVNLVKDLVPERFGSWVPLPMAMAVPFLVGAYFTIDMCVGTLIVFVWRKIDEKRAELMVPAVASGLICGEGLWILPSSILALAKVKNFGYSKKNDWCTWYQQSGLRKLRPFSHEVMLGLSESMDQEFCILYFWECLWNKYNILSISTHCKVRHNKWPASLP
ncbi:hypothetical protein AMTR_s00027p00045420 [Amborella trichopoda]|uniref:Uncharacterized protein n=1 Tax=Amborella trichopoda TaxID=13333 RepID=W1PL36_AMBTC|nr:hypothetical protein AMTR_s00027p00045420 [Amborella trichopoda]